MFKKFFQEFKEFAFRGNVMDLAIGVIIGGAFSGIVSSLVNNLITPLIGLLGKRDFSEFSFQINGVPIHYGAFITEVINFVIMAFAIFLLVKGMNALANLGKKEEKEPEAPTTRQCPYCLSDVPIKATRCAYCTSQLPEYEPDVDAEVKA